MADLSNLLLTQYGSKVQAFSTQNGINTSSLVEMELSLLEQKFAPVENQLKYAQTEQSQWRAMETAFQKFQESLKTMQEVTSGNKGVELSSNGAFEVTARNSAASNQYSVQVEQLATNHKVLIPSAVEAAAPLNKQGTVRINGKELVITPDMSIKDIATQLNREEYGMTATMISSSLVLTAKQSGEENKITFEDSDGILESLGFINSDGSIRNEITEAKDAVVHIDGVRIQNASNEMNNVIEGVSLNLKNTTTSAVNMKIGENGDTLKEEVKNFVNAFNTLVRTVSEYTGEGKGLQGESILTRAKSDIQSIVTSNSNGYFYELGINFDSIAKDGTIRIDERKLDDVLKNDYQKVVNMFNGQNGVVEKMNTQIDRLIGESGNITGKIESFGETISRHEKTIASYEESYERQKQMILNKYVQYEKQMASLNSLTTQISALVKSWENAAKAD